VTSADGVRPVYHVLGPLNRTPKGLKRRDLGRLDPWILGVWRLETRISKAGDLRISGSEDPGPRNTRFWTIEMRGFNERDHEIGV